MTGTEIRFSLQPQLIVERLLELEQRCFVVQARSIEPVSYTHLTLPTIYSV